MDEFIRIMNNTGECEIALLNKTKNEIVIKGNQYDDKIYEKIQGFFEALDYYKIKYNILEDQYIGTENILFKECRFYDWNED